MKAHLQSVFGATFAIVLCVLMIGYVHRQFTNTYAYVEASQDWRLIAALLVVGAMIYSLMVPHWIAKVGGWLLVLTAAGATAIGNAAPLGLINLSPPLWNVIILLVATGGIGIAVAVVSVGMKEHVAKPLELFIGIETAPKPLPKPLPKPKPKRKLLGMGARLRGFLPIPKPSDGIETNDNTDTETNEKLFETMQTLAKAGPNGKEGRVAAAAAQLGISTAAVNKQLKKLYTKDPATVEANIPKWVERNIKEDAEV